MGIALGYAFLLAIAGGLIAICLAWLGELLEEDAADTGRTQPDPRGLRASAAKGAMSRPGWGGLRHQI